MINLARNFIKVDTKGVVTQNNGIKLKGKLQLAMRSASLWTSLQGSDGVPDFCLLKSYWKNCAAGDNPVFLGRWIQWAFLREYLYKNLFGKLV